jgi:hypothetical protein
MINLREVKKYCKEDVSLIENYDIAMNDKSQTWHCHHKLGVNTDYCNSTDELKLMGIYYDRPACELIFVTKDEHRKIHSVNSIGAKNGMFGTHKTEEEKVNLSKKLTGIKRSKETKEKMSKTRVGKAYSEFAIKYKEYHGYGHNENPRQYDTEKHYFYRNGKCPWEV